MPGSEVPAIFMSALALKRGLGRESLQRHGRECYGLFRLRSATQGEADA